MSDYDSVTSSASSDLTSSTNDVATSLDTSQEDVTNNTPHEDVTNNTSHEDVPAVVNTSQEADVTDVLNTSQDDVAINTSHEDIPAVVNTSQEADVTDALNTSRDDVTIHTSQEDVPAVVNTLQEVDVTDVLVASQRVDATDNTLQEDITAVVNTSQKVDVTDELDTSREVDVTNALHTSLNDITNNTSQDDVTNSTSQNDVTVVIDIGSGCFRGGLAGEDNPQCELPTVTMHTSNQTNCGADSDLKWHYPIERGCVKDWGRVESLLHSVYNHLHVQHDSQHALLLTRHVFDPVSDAVRYVEIGLESLGARGVYLAVQPVLSLYANGCTDGVVLDCGEGVTQVVPVFGGYAIDHAVLRQDLAGRDVSDRLQTLLTNRRPHAVHVDLETSRQIKERLCYVAPNFDLEVDSASDTVTKSYTLPNGDVISVDEERFRSPEILFKPSLIGSECLGLPKLVHKSVSACPIDIRGHLLERVIVAGGTTKIPGICRRLLSELTTLSPQKRVKILADAGRQHSAWLGGSVLASLPSFPSLCVTKQEFLEHGAVIVRKKLL